MLRGALHMEHSQEAISVMCKDGGEERLTAVRKKDGKATQYLQ